MTIRLDARALIARRCLEVAAFVLAIFMRHYNYYPVAMSCLMLAYTIKPRLRQRDARLLRRDG